mmetsp:Transcript_18788/g.63991  ORF Transcript_18788/g.63991 Transcript_18788/m.63991 type:complete len:92 (-) Transcript_18788:1385-1660(-)
MQCAVDMIKTSQVHIEKAMEYDEKQLERQETALEYERQKRDRKLKHRLQKITSIELTDVDDKHPWIVTVMSLGEKGHRRRLGSLLTSFPTM